MADHEPFTLIEESTSTELFDTFHRVASGKFADPDIQYIASLRKAFPEYIVTAVPTGNCNLLAFAQAGHAVAELDIETDYVVRWRGWAAGLRPGQQGSLAENIFFAKYRYQWNSHAFFLWTVGNVQYVLTEPRGHEQPQSNSGVTDNLIAAAGTFLSADKKVIWLFDNYWQKDKALYEQVRKAEWKNVILDEKMKQDLTEVSERFFDSKSVYEDLGVPWKRGIIFHGPPGNGKTISIKALMHTLLNRTVPVPTLYVKSAPQTFYIRQVFLFARKMAPCLLVFEDIDTIIKPATRSYFFNEVDGLEGNDGILMVASTNHLDELDPGIARRPSRFDRKYLFPLPSRHERTLYCEYWRHKLEKKKSSIEFPEKLCPAIAGITKDFSFAYLQEAFVAALLAIARDEREQSAEHEDDGNDDLNQYQLWVVMKKQVKILRQDMDESKDVASQRRDETATQAEVLEMSELSRALADQAMLHMEKPAVTDLDKVKQVKQLAYDKIQYINPSAFLYR